MMKMVLTALVAAALSAGIAWGATQIPFFADEVLIVPKDSPVHFLSKEPHGPAVFDGKFVLTGTYYYGDAEFNDGPEVMLELTFIPDPAMAARLPYFKQRGRPHAVFLTNGAAFANAVISKTTLAALTKKGAPRATGRVSIWVDKFKAEVVCDAPEFNARFVSVYKPAVLVALAKAPEIGC
jgi:hypothetical protein